MRGLSIAQRAAMLEDLRVAIATETLLIHWEPIINLATAETAGYEALVRWQKNGRLIPPSDFLSVLVGSDFEIEWVRGQLGAIRKRLATTKGFIALNLSGYALEHPELPRMIRDEIWEPGRLCIEVNEEVLISADSPALEALQALKDQAHPLAVDDFGTGYSSFLRLLSHCQGLFSLLKLDRQLVHGCANDFAQQTLIQALLFVARKLNFKVVAEGIERAEDAAWLADQQCDYGQGYLYLGKPKAG